MKNEEFFSILKKKTPEDLQTAYRMVFGGENGRKVLADILFNFCNFCGYVDHTNPAEVGSYNVGTAILLRMGIPKGMPLTSLIKALIEVPVTQGGNENG